MNVLYILGNGFDKAQGMATSYPEFYQYLEKQKGSALLELLKVEIKSDKKLWSDMEEALGIFTVRIKSSDEVENLYFELSDYLQDYLKSEENKFTPSNELKTKFLSDFVSPGKYLGESDILRYNAFANSLAGGKDISVISFNYTNSFEKLVSIDQDNKGKKLEKNFGNNRVLRNLIHVHGILGDSIILGVDNEEQIANKQFRTNDDVKDFLVKTQSNKAIKTIRHLDCEKFIRNANLIILFGVSLGKTDLRWWNLIGKEFKRRKNLAIIQHVYRETEIMPTRKHILAKVERKCQEFLFDRMCIDLSVETESVIDEMKDRMFFIINSDMFK